MYTIENIGADSPHFKSCFEDIFTQCLIKDDQGMVIAQTFGPLAKIRARAFITLLEGK